MKVSAKEKFKTMLMTIILAIKITAIIILISNLSPNHLKLSSNSKFFPLIIRYPLINRYGKKLKVILNLLLNTKFIKQLLQLICLTNAAIVILMLMLVKRF